MFHWGFILVFLFSFVFSTITLAIDTFSFENFSDLTKTYNLLKLNGSAKVNANELWLADGSRGSVFTKQKVSLGGDRSFSTNFSFKGPYQDGFCFVLQQESNSALGGGGSGLGINGISQPIVAVEIDTIDGNGDELSQPHVALDINPITIGSYGCPKHYVGASIPWDLKNTPNTVYYVWVDYYGANTVGSNNGICQVSCRIKHFL